MATATRSRPAAPQSPRPKLTIDGRVSPAVDLVLDSRLTAMERIILIALNRFDRWWAITTDPEMAERHGVSEKTIQNALAAGERAGWIARFTPAELKQWLAEVGREELWRSVPSGIRAKARRFIVFLDRVPGLEPKMELDLPRRGRRPPSLAEPEADYGVNPEATCGVDPEPVYQLAGGPGSVLPDEPVPGCEVLACAGASNLDEFTSTKYEPPVIPQKEPEVGGSTHPRFREWMAMCQRGEEKAAALPPMTPRMQSWSPSCGQGLPAPGAYQREVDARIAEQLGRLGGPERADAVVQLVAALSLRFKDHKPQTVECWRRHVGALAMFPQTRQLLAELIAHCARPEVPKPANLLSKCLANATRGRPSQGAQKLTPGQADQSVPGVSRNRSSCPVAKCTQEVIP